MKEPHVKGKLHHHGPELYVYSREAMGEDVDRGKRRPAIELLKSPSLGCRPCGPKGKATLHNSEEQRAYRRNWHLSWIWRFYI